MLAGDWIDTGLAGHDRKRRGQRPSRRARLAIARIVRGHEIRTIDDEVDHRPLPGDRAQGKQPAVVRRAARAQSRGRRRRRSRRPRCARADGPDRDRARAGGGLGRQSRSGWRRVFGIANFARAGRAPLDVEAIAAADPRRPRCRDDPPIVPGLGAPRRQAIPADLAARSSAKSAAGSRKRAAGTSISANPELTIHVEALTDEAFYYFGKERGAGGLPAGTSGRVVCLLSGGIDSPVAAWRMMRRGCRVLFVHFHSYPILSRASQEKARELARAADAVPVSTRGSSWSRSARSSSASCSPSPRRCAS